MPSPFRLFNAGAAFGPGRAAPRPSVRKRIADIVSLVDGPTTSGGGIDDPEDIFRIARRFQRKRNLKPDGIVNPGGSTEGALNAFAVANDKGGRQKLIAADVPAERRGAAESGGSGIDPFGGVDNPTRDGRFTSGAVCRTADRIANETEASRRERDEERKHAREKRKSHRDVEKIEWEKTARKSKLTGKYAARVKDAIRVDLESDIFLGFDGLRYTVDWQPLDANGQVMPEFQRPRPKKPEFGGHVAGRGFRGRSSRVFVSPYPHPHGFRVEVEVPPQPPVNGTTPGADLSTFVPKGEFVSEEILR